jgi:hypothetical protein
MIRLSALLASVLLTCQAAYAQTTPCVGCAIARQQSAAQVRSNQATVSNTLQNTLNAQLQAQSNALQAQALQRSLQLNGWMNASSLELQQLLLQQQLQILQIRQRELLKAQKTPPAIKKTKKSSKPGS